MLDLNALALDIYQQNKEVGWWDDPNRCILTTIQLISTEIAEATEGERKNLMDDHLPHRKMGEVELADALIRTLDFGGRFELVVPIENLEQRTAEVFNMCKHQNESAAVCHFWINKNITELGVRYATCKRFEWENDFLNQYADLIAGIIGAAEHLGYDIMGAVQEKLAYNKQRLDHKREARAQDNGKKF